MQQCSPPHHRFCGCAGYDLNGMIPDVTVMVWVELLEAKHRLNLGHYYSKDVCVVTKYFFDALTAKHFRQLNLDPFSCNRLQKAFVLMRCLCSGGFDIQFKGRCKTQST